MLLCQHLEWAPWGKEVAVEQSAARGRSVSRLNILIAITAAIIGLIYGYDLGSIASALLFLVPAFHLTTFMTSVVTSAVVLGSCSGPSSPGASPTPSGASAP
jgi:SP family galactose:H+ symporter-like MFS transporter